LHFVHPLAYTHSLNVCWALNHQNLIEMAQGHISLSDRRVASFARQQQDDDVQDAGVGGGPLPLHPRQGEDRAGMRHEPTAPPLLHVHPHHVPVGVVPRRHDDVLPQLPVLRRHLLQVLGCLLGRPALGRGVPVVSAPGGCSGRLRWVLDTDV
jgi:hypothetical protein